MWKQEKKSSFEDFLRWYNNKDVVPFLQPMQRKNAFSHDKDVDMLKPGSTIPNLAIIYLHKPTQAKIYPSQEGDKNLLEKIREEVVGGPSIVLTRKAVVDETFIRKSTNVCKTLVGIDASQLYPYSMCQPIPTGFYTRWNVYSASDRFTPRRNKIRSFENLVLFFFQRTKAECKCESFYTTGRQKKIECFSAVGFATLCSNQGAAFTTFVPVNGYVHLSLKKVPNAAVRRESSLH